jgi:hypothetical protein
MKKPLTYRLHEWAADRFDSVQYPPMRAPERRLFRFKHQMPWYERIGIIVASSTTIVVGLVVLAALLFGAYIMIVA